MCEYRYVDRQREINKVQVINKFWAQRTHRLISCTGKRRSSAALAAQPIRQTLLPPPPFALASASASFWTAAAASVLAERFALGCSDMALQMRRLLMAARADELTEKRNE